MATKVFKWMNYLISAILKPVLKAILKRFKKHYLVTTLVAIGCLFSTTSVATNSLSDSDLAGVYGGGVDPQLEGQVLPQEQQQPDNNNSAYTLPQPLPSNDGMELSPELFTILQSSIDATRERMLMLSGETQQGARALNLNNSLSSDLVSTNNIFNGGNLNLDDVTTAIEVNQLNELHQLHRSQGSLDSSIAGFSYEEIFDSRSGSESYDYHVYSSIYLQRQSSLLSSNYDYIGAQVGSNFTSLDEFTSSLLPLQIIEPFPFPKIFDLPPIGVSVLGTGATLDYTGIQLFGFGLTIDSIAAGGEDDRHLVLGTIIKTPKLDFGVINGEACFAYICTEPTPLWDFGHLGGLDINSEFVLEDLAPDVKELNLGSGFSFNGDAELTANAGNLTINGELYVRITPYARVTLDLSKLVLLGVNVGNIVKDLALLKDDEGNGTNIKTYEWSIDLVNEHFPFELLDKELVIAPIEIGFVDKDHSFEQEVLAQNIEDIEIYKFNDEADSSVSEFYEHTVFTGGQMTGAQAELLALSEGILTVENNSNLSFSQSAQKNIRVFNGVNAVSAVAANALNISWLPASSALSKISMQQRNIFIQQR